MNYASNLLIIINLIYRTSLNNIFGSQVQEYVLGDGVAAIGSFAFSGCSGLTSIAIPESVTSIGDYAFSGCSRLKSIYCPKKLNYIGKNAFKGCNNLRTSIYISENIRSVGEQAFEGVAIDSVFIANLSTWCKAEVGQNTWGQHLIVDGEEVSDLEIPQGVEKVSSYAFCGFPHIRSISLPNSMKEIGQGAFKGCLGLEKVVITNGVESIGQEAFMDAGLTSVVIPNSVKSIGAKAFANCIGLYSVTSLINTPFKLDPSVFRYYNSDYDPNSIYYGATLYVPRGRISFYDMVNGWKTFLKKEENDMKFKVTYVLDGEEFKVYELQPGEVVTPEPDPVRVGYEFNGWEGVPRVMPAEDVVVKGTYTVNKYIIRYYVGEQLIAEDEVEYGAEVVLRDYKPEDAALYTFIGWEGEKYETMPAHDIEYHAIIVDCIADISGTSNQVEGVYDANGRKLNQPQRGVNILLMRNGSKRKLVVK